MGWGNKLKVLVLIFVLGFIGIPSIIYFNSYIKYGISKTTNLVDSNVFNNTNSAIYSSSSLSNINEEVAGVETVSKKAMTCSDCFLFPVNKDNSLSSSYIPQDLVSSKLSGGGQLTRDTDSNLNNLFSDARKENINIKIVSGYRSYNDQLQTFNYWVGVEEGKGLSASSAIISANDYSAKEGHSEHELGTTVDLSCSSCNAFDSSTGNLNVYNFLEDNAYKYGFVISYPSGKENLTGYKYEPWHIRYIGVDLATELFNRGYLTNTSDYLEKFLEEKQLWN